MPSYTGQEIARDALRELGVLDPIEAGHAEQLDDARNVANDLLDTWRTMGLTIGGVTRSVYSLSSSTQSYTIGSGGTFDQSYPEEILAWSVIPDDDATDPVEQPKGRPLTWDQWQQIRVKSLDTAYPQYMYFDKAYAAGLGNCLFHPIPDNGDVDVVIYSRVPAITSLVAATTYDLRPGYIRALKLNLAVELGQGRYARQRGLPDGLERRAKEAFGQLKRFNHIPRVARIAPEFIIGSGRRSAPNIYTDS